MHGEKWWKCKNCAADNKSKTACAICGLRRSYADVAKQAVDQSPKKGADGKQGNPIRQHLEEVASKLAAVAAGRDSHQPMDVQTNELDFKAGKAKLAKLEAALRAMPEDDKDFANERMANGNDVPNARLRAKSAKEAYGPLALRIFGSGHTPAPLKLSLYMSLVESRNSFSMHIAPPSVNALRIVASVYNRALRRIAGIPRFEKDEHALSDLEVRGTLKVPSYDCILMRGRLRHVGRIVRTRPSTLVAMLSIRTGEPPAPPEWFESAGGHALCVENHGSTRECATTRLGSSLLGWRDEGQGTIVKSVHFFESALDNRAAKKFASERALAAHAQRVHGYRTEWSKRIDDSGVCPVCKATFHTRIRVLNHVRSSNFGDLPELAEEIIERYRKADAAEIRTARLDGRSAPTARRSATSHDGKMRPGAVARL